MTALADLTDAAPVRRMSVARGILRAPTGQAVDDRRRGAVEATVASAVKRAAELLPGQHPVQPTHIDVLFAEAEGAVTLTVTVQAYARGLLDSAALLGVVTGLLALRQGLGGGSLEGVEVVQNVAA